MTRFLKHTMKNCRQLLIVAVACPVLMAFLAGASDIRPAEGAEDAGSRATNPQETGQASPQKIYEAVSGYYESLHKAFRDKKSGTPKKEQRREPRTHVTEDREPEASGERDEALALTRTERNEWDLTQTALNRAVRLAQNTGAAERASRLAQALSTTRDKLSAGSAEPSPTPGEYVNSLGMRLIAIRPGKFLMGSSAAEARRIQGEWNAGEDILRPEQPAHTVRLGEPFLLGKYPVTVGQFKQFVRDTGYRTVAEKQGWGWVYSENERHWAKKSGASWHNPGAEIWDDYPVTLVCHADAEAFCDWLGKRENRRYYLPTEAQWEYAARGGKESERFPWGDEYPDGKKLNMADRRSPVPWADRSMDDGASRVSPVGSYEPNGFWLYDMVGNVWQLCSDYFDASAYEAAKSTTVTDPTGPRTGKKRVVRGGNWAFGAGIARNAFRFGIDLDLCADLTGFRIAAVPTVEQAPSEKAQSVDILNREHLSRLMTRIKNLVESGRRIEARQLVEDLKEPDTKGQLLTEHPGLFVRDVLDALVDVTKSKKQESFANSLGMKMVRIPAGAFVMGSSETDIAWALGTLAPGQPLSLENEFPFHKVRLTRPFFIGETPVTVGQFRRFAEDTGYMTDAEAENGGQIFNADNSRFEQKAGSSWKNPGFPVSDNQPVTMVSWDDAQAFVEWLASKEKLPYKLPTEAQWEYACRGGQHLSHFPWGDGLPDGKRANYADSSSGLEWRDRNADDGYKYGAPVGTYEANPFGLYDMAGNVLQWVRDYYSEDYYRFTPEVDPEGPGQGENRITKGGDFTSSAAALRCAFRGWSRPEGAFYNTGFRVMVELGAPLRPFHLANDFLTREWVPDTDQRSVAMAVAKEDERRQKVTSVDPSKAQLAEKQPAYELIKGIQILSFTPKSDARKARLSTGDVIIEYNGERDLTSEKFLALTALTKKERSKPIVVFVRDGHEYSVRVPPGFLGITVMDTTVRAPDKTQEPEPEPRQRDDKDKKSKHLDWT
jgi:formylglycine-generating enzyme